MLIVEPLEILTGKCNRGETGGPLVGQPGVKSRGNAGSCHGLDSGRDGGTAGDSAAAPLWFDEWTTAPFTEPGHDMSGFHEGKSKRLSRTCWAMHGGFKHTPSGLCPPRHARIRIQARSGR